MDITMDLTMDITMDNMLTSIANNGYHQGISGYTLPLPPGLPQQPVQILRGWQDQQLYRGPKQLCCFGTDLEATRHVEKQCCVIGFL